jgi:hypothetical protein
VRVVSCMDQDWNRGSARHPQPRLAQSSTCCHAGSNGIAVWQHILHVIAVEISGTVFITHIVSASSSVVNMLLASAGLWLPGVSSWSPTAAVAPLASSPRLRPRRTSDSSSSSTSSCRLLRLLSLRFVRKNFDRLSSDPLLPPSPRLMRDRILSRTLSVELRGLPVSDGSSGIVDSSRKRLFLENMPLRPPAGKSPAPSMGATMATGDESRASGAEPAFRNHDVCRCLFISWTRWSRIGP